MIRTEYIVVGIILVLIGLALVIIGYDKIQPTMLENVATFAEAVSGSPAPQSLYQPKTMGYFLLAGGGAVVFVGLGFIFFSRKK